MTIIELIAKWEAKAKVAKGHKTAAEYNGSYSGTVIASAEEALCLEAAADLRLIRDIFADMTVIPK